MAIPDWISRRPFRAHRPEQSPSVIEDADVQPSGSDTRQPVRIGLWGLGVGLGGFLLWASLAHLDEGVPTSGMVAIDTKRKTVQHLRGGIVQQVYVKEGQLVRARDPLFRLDDKGPRAEYESLRQNYLTLRAMEGRLLAEQSGAARPVFHPDLLKSADDPLVRQFLDSQRQLFDSRRGALEAEVASIEESIQANEGQLQGYRGMLEQRRQQNTLLVEELKGIRNLVAEGYAPRNRQLELERTLAEITSGISDIQGNIVRLQRTNRELRQRVAQRRMEFRRDSDTQLTNVLREVQADADKMKAAQDELERTIIPAPTDGQVVGLSVQTVGAVIQAGQKLLDIVPQDETLILETHVPPHVIDRVRPGLEVDVRFSAFAHSPQLVVPGKVASISTDLITEAPTGPYPPASYYLARVAITSEGRQALGNRQLQAGMPVEVIIRTGERTVLTYLLHPLSKRLAQAMKEE